MNLKSKQKRKISEEHSFPQMAIDGKKFTRSFQKGMNDSRLAAWSTPGKVILDYLSNTTPRFSTSKKIALYLEEGLRKEYPELWDAVQKRL